MLLDYIRNVADSIIAEKRLRGVSPAAVTRNEILSTLVDDVTDCMRALASSGEYQAHITVNKIPMLTKDNSNER